MALTVDQQVRGIVTLDDRFSGKLRTINRGLNDLGKYGGRAITNLGRNFERLGLIAGGAAVYGLKRTVEAAADFDDAMAAVEKTLEPGEKTRIDEIKEDLLALSKTLPITAVELADIARQAGQLGVAVDDMDEFVNTIAKLSKVTELDVNYAAENMGKLMTIFDLSGAEVEDFADTLVRLENNAASTVQEILNVSRRFAAAGKAAGLTADEIAALASTITSLGVLPEAGGSALSRIFERTRNEFAVTSDKAKEFAKVLKMPFEEAKKLLAEDPSKFFVKFFESLNKVYESGTALEQLEVASLLKKLGINNVRDINAVQQLAGGVEELKKQLGLANEEGNDLDEAAASRFKSFANQYQLFKNKVTALQIQIGEKLFPALLKIMDRVSVWFEQNADKVAAFGDELAAGFNAFADMMTPERLDGLANALGTAADFAKTIIRTFLDMPEWLRNILVGVYVGNKLTGGVLADVIGEVGKGLIKGILGINAGVVNINAGVVNGGGVGGPGVLAGGGGGLLAILTRAFALGAGAITIPWVLSEWQKTAIQPGLQQQADSNSAAAQKLLATGTIADVQAAIAALKNFPNTLNPLERTLYDLNQNGVKTHNEDLIKYLESHLPFKDSTPGTKDDLHQPALKKIQQDQLMALRSSERVEALERQVKNNTAEMKYDLDHIRQRPPQFTATNKVTINLSIDGKKMVQTIYASESNQTAKRGSGFLS